MDTPHISERRSVPPQPIRLLFSSDDEFIQELRERGPNVEPLVRVTFKTADASGAPLTHLTLLATFLRAIDDGTHRAQVVTVVQLAEYLGSLWIDPTDEASQRCQERAEHLRAAVVRAVEELGLRVGGGAYLVGERVAEAGVAGG
jgi:hypothetical protein